MLDFQLAELYGVETRALKQQVRRNIRRFPIDFMFELTNDEIENMVSQSVIPSKSYFGGAKAMAFTEQGVAMLSSVLRSDRAVQVNIAIMRTFVKLRELISTHKELAVKLGELERKLEKHDKQIHTVFEAIRQLMAPPVKPKNALGFQIEKTGKKS